ncbi:uncharacterized protein LOC126664308 isoform X2 [Mercurialis annua]|uniref:uncharacterized protein LOC126664308 isoform X2 n=1 Tax=Mercurialis annua TaxID=3986 RepID=UPI00215F54F1|nr:uncharacterized protein LOC126664308 isoform X2 [Mercurialis annua]
MAVSNRVPLKSFIKHFPALCTLRDALRSYCTTHSVDQIESLSIPLSGTGTNGLEFLRWRNGGGMFHKSANIDPTALVEIGAVVHSEAAVGANVLVGSGAVIGPNVVVGHFTKIVYKVSLSNCSIGVSCVIHNGVCIGQDGSNSLMAKTSCSNLEGMKWLLSNTLNCQLQRYQVH